MRVARLLGCLSALPSSVAAPPPNVDAMVAAATSLIDSAMVLEPEWTSERYRVAVEGLPLGDAAAEGVHEARHGVYGEFPLRGMAELLSHPAVRPTLRFVDVGSGAGRLLVGVAAMLGDDASVVGVEASAALHLLAEKAIGALVEQRRVRPAALRSLLADVTDHPPPPAVAAAMAHADVVFCYSTAFPSDDGLRLPELSATLASLLRADCIVITTDKWVVGDRFRFVALMTVRGEDDEAIQAFIWQVVGVPLTGGFHAALQDVQQHWMGEDACADNPAACAALVEAIDAKEAEQAQDIIR
ncbi:hypothetical protein AB1Y20_016941 [Prymnesium parvum]|uniref:DOT1 domain-containing protein n=1 Tax=Prymnesium parvum TaxID=97485 RepID=A0AB34I9Q3_PRYPA